MEIVSSEVRDKSLPDKAEVVYSHTEDGLVQVSFNHRAIAHILGRYACEQFPELIASGYVGIEITTDEYDQPLVVVTEDEE